MRTERLILRIQEALELLYLCLMTWCLSVPFALIFPEWPQERTCLLLGLGAGLMVTAIFAAAKPMEKRLPRTLVALAVALAVQLLPLPGVLRVNYGLCGLIAVIAGALVGRPKGKQVLRVPRLYHWLFPLLGYGLGRIGKLDTLSGACIVIAAMMVLVFVAYKNYERLLLNLRADKDTKVSDRAILELNLRMLLLFFAVGTALLVLLPWLLSLIPPAPPATLLPRVPYTDAPLPTHETQMSARVITPDVEAWDLSVLGNVFLWIFLVFVVGALGLAVFAVISLLRNLRDEKVRHSPVQSAGFEILSLDPQAAGPARRAEPPAGSYDKKVRRQYAKLIRSRTKEPDEAASPRELEDTALLPRRRARERIHTVYEKARYAPEEVSREEYKLMKAAIRQLNEETP